MGRGAIPATRNDRVRINRNDNAPSFLENKLESSDGSVGIEVSSCGCTLDLSVAGISGFAEEWRKYTIDFDHADLATGTATPTITIESSEPTGTIIVATRKKQTVSFSGASISQVDMSIGYSGDYDTPHDIFGVVIPPAGQSESPLYPSSCTGDIDVLFNITGGVDTDLGQGSVDIWIKTVVLT